jgi:hypothetical protein
MAECTLCHRKLGFFDAKVKLGPEQNTYCSGCAPKWKVERKFRAVEQLFRAGTPQVALTLHGVSTSDADCPSDGSKHALGKLVFLDSAVCFLQVASYSDSGRGLYMFGLLGGLIAAAVTEPDRQRAAQAARADRERGDNRDVREMLQSAERIVVYPRDQLVKVGYGFFSGLSVTLRNGRHCFALDGGKKAFKAAEPAVAAYLVATPSRGR